MLCARRTVLLHARRHHSFSSSHSHNEVADAKDYLEECRSRVREAKADEKAAARELRDLLKHSERDFHHGERGGYRGDHSRHWRGRGRGGRRCFRRFIAFMLVAGLLYAYFNVDEEKCNKALKECKENHRRHGCPFARDAHTETK
eukprot:Rhum_TRINITY_DN13971_c0_g1::Rhum_TRINITY_DN13971_c0_g1_i1::g.66769::m.66769